MDFSLTVSFYFLLRLPDKKIFVPSMAGSLLLATLAYANGEDVCVNYMEECGYYYNDEITKL